MELAYAFLADAAQFTSDGKLNMLGGDFNSIVAEGFPHIHPVIAIVMRFRINRDEAAVPHPVRLELCNLDRPEDPPMADIEGSFPATTILPTAEDPLFFANVSNVLGTVFTSAGNYALRIIADGRQVKEFPFTVALRSIPQGRGEG